MSARVTYSLPWTLACPWCDWRLVVNARGGRGRDQGSGYEAAILGKRHAEDHGRTWQDFLSARGGDAE
jgi:hypothetical protein